MSSEIGLARRKLGVENVAYHGAVSADTAKEYAEAVLSVKPRFVDGMAAGVKVWEVRKVPPRRDLTWAVLYASTASQKYRDRRAIGVDKIPEQRVVELVEIGDRVTADADTLHRFLAPHHRLTYDELEEYLDGGTGTAMEIVQCRAIIYEGYHGAPLSFFDLERAPQNFQYLKEAPR